MTGPTAGSYERITYRDAGRRRTVILDRPRDITAGRLGPLVIGTEVDADGCPIPPSPADLAAAGATDGTRTHVLAAAAIVRRERLTMDLTYGQLIPAPEATP